MNMKHVLTTAKGHIILLSSLILLSSCSTVATKKPNPSSVETSTPKSEMHASELLSFQSLAPLVMLNMNIQSLKRSPLYAPVTVPFPYNSLSEWVNRAEDAQFLRVHPLREVLTAFLALNLRGFTPNDAPGIFTTPISRGKFAQTLLELMLRSGVSPSILSEFHHQRSPFRDIDESSPFFNAVMITTSRSLLSFNSPDAHFSPQLPVKRGEAEAAIEQLTRLLR